MVEKPARYDAGYLLLSSLMDLFTLNHSLSFMEPLPKGGGRLFHQEGHLYHPDVIVKYNKTAWMNEKLMLEWLEEEWRSAMIKANRGEIFCLSTYNYFL